MTTRIVPPLAYTVAEAIQALPISRSKMFELIAAGQIRTVTVGSRRLVPVAALVEFLAALEAAEAAS